MDKGNIKIALIQTSVSENIDENLEKTSNFIEQAANKGAKLICLQELFATRYFCQNEDERHFFLAENIPQGKISQFLIKSAKENNITLLGGSLYELGDDGNRYNTALVIDPKGKIIGKYRKMHIPHDPNYFEQYYFNQGNLGYITVETPTITFSPLICFDQWFPEPARLLTLKNTQLICYPTAIGWFEEFKKLEPFSAKRWEHAMRSHASLNGIYIAAINRIGQEGKINFWGGSFIADPFGQVIAKASPDREEIIMADLNLEKIFESQEGWGFLRNRRPETYKDLAE